MYLGKWRLTPARQFESFCKVMSGFTDEFYQAKTAAFARAVVDEKPDDVTCALQPSVWLDPRRTEVWEIIGASISASPNHTCAGDVIQSEHHCGLSLRFPRFLRIRTDKGLDDVTSSHQIAERYRAEQA